MFTSAVQKVSQLRVLIFLELMNIVQSCNLVERQHIGELHMSREPCETNSDQIERGLCDCGAYKVHSILLQELHVVLLLMVTSHGAIAKRGLLLSRGHRADLATTRPKRFELRPGSRALLSFKTVTIRSKTGGCIGAGGGGCGHVMALHSMPAEWANGFGSGCAHFWRQSH